MITEAEHFRQYMSRMNISFDFVSFNYIIDSYCHRGNIVEAFSVYDDMVRYGHSPNVCMSRPVFQRRPNTRYMCAQEVHTYNNRIEISKQCLYKAGNILY
jgi:pentatricopeptide repeat protein